MQPHVSARRLAVETLEPRSLLAGDVLVAMQGDILLISGDDFDNAISIVSNGDGVTVEGFDTTINGSGAPATFDDVSRIEVRGNNGDDVVQSYLLVGSRVDELFIALGEGQDVSSTFTSAAGDIQIDGGKGADRVVLESFSSYGGGGSIDIVTGDGNDDIRLLLTQHQGNVHVDSGNGGDTIQVEVGDAIGNVAIDAGNGNDTVALDTVFGSIGVLNGDLNLEGGRGEWDALNRNQQLGIKGVIDLLQIEVEV